MYDQLLRNNSSNRLQVDLRTTMKTYNHAKERLTHQLANLHSTDHNHTNISKASHRTPEGSEAITPRKIYRAPNFAESNSSSGSYKNDMNPVTSGKKRKERKEHADMMKKEKEMLKLPVIHSASHKCSEWDSGKCVHISYSKNESFSVFEPLPGINAAKDFLAESMKIPSIYDPQRTDTAFDTAKNRKNAMKVTFADENHRALHSINQIEANNTESKQVSKNSEGIGPVPRLNLKADQFSHISKSARQRKTSNLPPLQLSLSKVWRNPQQVTEAVNHWKTLYSKLVNQEQKTKALADIFAALRVKKYKNEQSMKYGESPRVKDMDKAINGYLEKNSIDRIAYKDESGQVSIYT